MKKIIISISTFLILYSFANAQSKTAKRNFDHNRMFWFNGVINGKLNNEWSYTLEIEYRRQADPEHGYKTTDKVGNSRWNIFKNPFQEALRPWIHYQPNDKIRFSLSPITWFATWSFPVNGQTKYRPELRTSPQITLYHKHGRVQLLQRYRLEFRFFGVNTTDNHTGDPTGPAASYKFDQGYDANGQSSDQHVRFRYMLRAIIPLNSYNIEKGTHYIVTNDEIFFKFGNSVQNANIFDQNRVYLGYGYKFHREMKLEIGYLNQIAFKLNNGYGVSPGNNIDFNNILYTSLIIENLHNLFKKKDKK